MKRNTFLSCLSALVTALPPGAKAAEAPPATSAPPVSASVNRLVRQTLPPTPSEADLRAWQSMPEPLVPLDAGDDAGDRRDLSLALSAWVQRSHTDDHSALRTFVADHPSSRWSPSIRLNLGNMAYQSAWFSLALEDWRWAWEKSRKSSTADGVATAALANYCGMLSRLGRKKDLEAALRSARGRTFEGGALQRYAAACEALSIMNSNPGISFRCGPFALVSIREKLSGKSDFSPLHEIQSPEGGFSVAEVLKMSQDAGMKMIAARRSPGAKVLLPCVVHLKLDHYAALLEEYDGRYLLKDPTFASQHWISKNALDHEASGAFLIPEQKGGLPKGWEPPSPADLNALHGKGFVNCVTVDGGPGSCASTAPPPPKDSSGCEDDPCPSGTTCVAVGMPQYSLMPIPCSLVIRDTPVMYKPAFGPAVPWRLSYHQRTWDQPATMLFSNYGRMWSGEFHSYLEDDPGNLAANVTIHLRNGGFEVATYIPATGLFSRALASDATLVRISPGVYERRFRDGSREVFGLAIGTSGPNRKVFLTQIVDAQGRALKLFYDTDPDYPTRLKFVRDATVSPDGPATELFYEVPGSHYLISRVRDRFGREARFSYSDTAVRRLLTIRDAVGMESSFTYKNTGDIDSMTTPYGRTTFAQSSIFNFENAGAEARYVEVTDPTGLKERIEYRTEDHLYGVPGIQPNVPAPFGVVIHNRYNNFRNVFCWDKKAMRILGGSVKANPAASLANATVRHYLHSGNAASGVLESIQRPLQSRVYYKYPGGSGFSIGTSTIRSAEARLVEDGNGSYRSEVIRREVNLLGRITKIIDAVGRETTYEYDTNGIDLRFTKQKIGAVYQTIQEIQYNPAFPPHLPWKIIDASGQTTTYAYNSRGQVVSITNALNETTLFNYDEAIASPSFGALLATVNSCCGGAHTTFTYDAALRVRTVTDSAGYTLTYDYDDLDRVTKVTYPDSTFEETTYDRLDVGSKRDRMGRVTQMKYNSLRQLVMSIDPAQRVLQYDYCSCGAMKLLVDGNGNRTTWDYDVLGRVISKRYADGRGDDYAYEPRSGRLSSITDAKGQIKKFTYNADGTLRKLDYQNEQIATPDVTYTYDPDFNRLATMVDGIGTHTYSYFPSGVLGAMQVHTLDGPFIDPVPLTDLVTYTYDEMGRVKTRNIGPTGTENKITWGYDALGRVVSEVNNLCPQTPAPTQFTYNYVGTTGRLASVDYPNGQRTLYDYWPAATPGQPGNGDFRLKQIANFGQGTDPSTLLSRFDYTYDTAGNILTWGRKLGAAAMEQTYTLGYDEADQLARGILHETANPNNLLYRYYATFDKAGNRLSKQENDTLTGYAYNNLNQLIFSQAGGNLVVGGHTDEPVVGVTVNGMQAKLSVGNKWEAIVPVTAGNNTLAVAATDAAQPANTRIKSWTVTVGAASSATFDYDFNGNTTASPTRTYAWNANNEMSGISSGGESLTYRFDGLGRCVAEFDSNGDPKRRWLWIGFQRTLEIDLQTTTTTYADFHGRTLVSQSGLSRVYYTFDHLGSVREVVNPAAAAEVRYDYDPFGLRSVTVGTSQNGSQYAGLTSVSQIDKIQLAVFRGYEGDTGRWFSRDKLRDAEIFEGPNLYTYARNNSIVRRDPSGLSSILGDCGSKWWQQLIIPDQTPPHLRNQFGNCRIAESCQKHDNCYDDSCNTGKTKQECDMEFFHDIVRSNSDPQCVESAYSYYGAVATKAKEAYDSARERCCKAKGNVQSGQNSGYQ